MASQSRQPQSWEIQWKWLSVEASGGVGVTEVSVVARRPESLFLISGRGRILLIYTASRPALEPTRYTVL